MSLNYLPVNSFNKYLACDVTHVNVMGKEGGIVFDYSMANGIICHENTVGGRGSRGRAPIKQSIASKTLFVSGSVV